MAKIYYDLITTEGSSWTLDMVPERWREEVKAMLDKEQRTA